jgi:5-formyltetrahydrofolate cyclo-ligase
MIKSAIRRRIRAARDAADTVQRAAWSAAICARAIAHPAYQRAQVVHVFLSFQSEVDTDALIAHALATGKRVATPVFPAGAEMAAAELNTLAPEAFETGLWGMRVLRAIRLIDPSAIDLVFAPLLAFAPQAGRFARIGYGKGHYDRFLPSLRPGVPVLGLAFELQHVAEGLPCEAHDVLIDDVLTEAAR